MRRCWSEQLCSNQRLHIRPHDIDYPTLLCAAPQLVHGGFLHTVGTAKCLDRGLHSNLGAELEAIRNGLCRAIDAQRSPVHRMGFDSKLEGGFGEVDDANRRIVQFWGPGASLHGKPEFEGVLGSQFVESEGGGEAQNSEWDPLRDFEEGFIGGDWGGCPGCS